MGLRLKISLMFIAIVLPMTLGFSMMRALAERQDMQERGVERAARRLPPQALARCEQHPERFRLHIKRLEAFAYNPQLISANPMAPPFPAALAEALKQPRAQDEDEQQLIHHSGSLWRADSVSVLKLADTGPCSYLLYVSQPPRQPDMMLWRLVLNQALVFFLSLLVSGLAITIPLVKRIRRLTEQVQRAPDQGLQIEAERSSKDELGDLARAFNAMGQRVQQTIAQLNKRDQTLKTYISNTTHDLAIPLTVLQHRLKRVREQVHQGATIEANELDGAMQEAHYIGSLIDNMSAAAKLDAGQAHLKRHRVDLAELVARVASRHEPIATLKHIELNWATPDEPLYIQADSTLLEQAINNLTQNAIQYVEPQGHVAIVLDLSMDGQRFELRVLDDGPGIPEGLMDSITDRAVRGDTDEVRTRNPKGQGFGLSIVTAVCQLHDYSLLLKNMEEGGLEATITGPLE